METIVFASNNAHKLQEIRNILENHFEVKSLHDIGCEVDIPETGLTFEENALQKAQYVKTHYGLDCFADDSGLEVDILGGAPGVETARYAGPERDANANMDKLLSEMARREKEAAMARTNGISTANATRSARFRTSVTLIVGGVHHFFDGVMEGHIATEKHGKGGFGYDPIFVPEGYTQTNAELGDKVKNAISHRSKALRAMAEFLKK